MKRVLFVLFALSLGLNAGLLYTVIAQRHARAPEGVEAPWMAPELPGPPRGAPEDGPGGPPGHPMPDRLAFAHRRLARMATWLNLDTPQRDALRAILDTSLPAVLAQRDTVRKARRLAAAEYVKPIVNPDSVRILVRRLNAAQAALDSLVAETMSREAALLTPEQRARYFSAMPWGDRPGAAGGPDAEHRRAGRPRRRAP